MLCFFWRPFFAKKIVWAKPEKYFFEILVWIWRNQTSFSKYINERTIQKQIVYKRILKWGVFELKKKLILFFEICWYDFFSNFWNSIFFWRFFVFENYNNVKLIILFSFYSGRGKKASKKSKGGKGTTRSAKAGLQCLFFLKKKLNFHSFII